MVLHPPLIFSSLFLTVSIVELFAFIKSFHLTHEVSDSNYPVVDIKISHSRADEDDLEKLHYHK